MNTETLKDNPDFGKALIGVWYETMATMSDPAEKGKAAREAMAKLSGTDLAGYEAQLKTTRMFYTPKEMVAFVNGAGADQDHGSRAYILLRSRPARRRRQEPRTRSGIAMPAGETLGRRRTRKLRFDSAFAKMAADDKL